MPRTKIQAKVDGTDKLPPEHIKYVKQETGGWKVLLNKGGTVPVALRGLYLTDADARKATELWYATNKR